MRWPALLPMLAVSCVGLQDLGDRDNGDAAVAEDSGPSDGASDASSDAPDVGDMVTFAAPGAITVRWGGIDRITDATSTVKLTRGFAVDRTEVTVGAFRAWVDAGMPAPCPGATCTLDPGGPYEATMKWNPGDDKWVAVTHFKSLANCDTVVPKDVATWAAGDDRLPINCLTYGQAAAYCHYRGKRLLTEIEWYWVASGRGQARIYPAGDTPPKTCADALFGLDGTTDNPCSFPKPVGSVPADRTRDGLLDMTGSLREWVYGIPPGKFVQPATLPDDWSGEARTEAGDTSGSGEQLLVRGGAFDIRTERTATSYASRASFYIPITDVGLRCAKSL